jgi:hypothetical protein
LVSLGKYSFPGLLADGSFAASGVAAQKLCRQENLEPSQQDPCRGRPLGFLVEVRDKARSIIKHGVGQHRGNHVKWTVETLFSRVLPIRLIHNYCRGRDNNRVRDESVLRQPGCERGSTYDLSACEVIGK